MRKVSLYLSFIWLCLRYVVSLSALSTALFFRVNIGSNLYAPFTTKPFGKGKDKYRATPEMRLWFMFLLYVYFRIFFVLCFVSDADFFNVNEWASWGQIFTSFYTFDFFGNPSYPDTAGFFFVLSIIAPLVVLAQLTVSYEILNEHKRPEETYLGQSVAFEWWNKKTNHQTQYLIWGVIEPLCIALIGGLFYIFSFPPLAYFFWLSAIGLCLQGQLKRIKLGFDKRAFVGAIIHRDKVLELQEDLADVESRKKVKEPKKEKENRAPEWE